MHYILLVTGVVVTTLPVSIMLVLQSHLSCRSLRHSRFSVLPLCRSVSGLCVAGSREIAIGTRARCACVPIRTLTNTLQYRRMSKPYDAVTKRLIEMRPADWVAFLRLPEGDVSLVDADLSTITLQADRIIRVVTGAGAYLVHNELESGESTTDVPTRLFHYNASIFYKLRLPVVSTVFLLHKESNSPQITGTFDLPDAHGNIYFSFRYNVVKVWQLDVDELLTGGLSTLPFAPIANVRPTELPRVIKTMQKRIEAEATSDTEEGELWTATKLLMGLRYNEAFHTELLRKVYQMRESNAYQQILREGRTEGLMQGRTEGAAQEARRILLRQGLKRFGAVSAATEARVQAIGSLTVLEDLLDRVLAAQTWDELLASVS